MGNEQKCRKACDGYCGGVEVEGALRILQYYEAVQKVYFVQ
jgi:hypothetical protein